MARRAGAEAIHPGYGFLAENAPFAQACEDAGIVFIGPPASAIEAMGSKTRARELMQAAGVPIVPGTTEPVATVADALRIAKEEIGFPVAVKAAGGGGGKGFRVACFRLIWFWSVNTEFGHLLGNQESGAITKTNFFK